MSELVAESKVLTVYMKCELCNSGVMLPTGNGIILATYPPQYPHKCNNCGSTANYPVRYPYQRIVLMEELREPTENELCDEN